MLTAWPPNWTAHWIWASPPPRETGPLGGGPGVPPEATWHRIALLRATVHCTSVPAHVPARVTADSRFALMVNGSEVLRGPSRSSAQLLPYHDIDLAQYLRPGDNVIAARVIFYGRPNHWWVPATPAGTLGFGSFLFEAPAIGLVSDASWRGMETTYSLGKPPHWLAPAPEIFDGSGFPPGWAGPAFDDSGWAPAAELHGGTQQAAPDAVPASPFYVIERADVAPQTAIAVDFNPLSERAIPAGAAEDCVQAYVALLGAPDTTGPDRLTTYDCGRLIVATPWIEVEGEKGAIVDAYCGEEVMPSGLVEIRPRYFGMRYVLSGAGIERFECPDTVGFRHLALAARGNVHVHAIGATERRYPTDATGAFACDDERLNTIWTVGARTLEVCATDAFIDCPGREQNAWVGDSYIHGLLTYMTTSDWRLARRHLRLCTQEQRADGLLPMIAAGATITTIPSVTIPDYSLHWVRALARYVEHSGDVATGLELLPAALRIRQAFERYRGIDGLLHDIPGWVFVDWAMTERAEVTGAVDALYAAALDDLAWTVETCLGSASLAAACRSDADRTRAAFEPLWDEARGVYVDAADGSGPRRRVSQHTNAAAIIARCAPPERWERMLGVILDSERLVLTPHGSQVPQRDILRHQWMDPGTFVAFDAERNVVMAQPFFSHIVHQAVVAAGHRELIPELCLRWWAQIERGNTTIEEYWDAPRGTASRAHAWSATPTYDLPRHVLGVRPLEPGYRKAEIRPLFGKLQRLSGRVPTPHGLIEVDLTRETGGTIIVPDGVELAVVFDDCALAGGELGPGQHTVEVAVLAASTTLA